MNIFPQSPENIFMVISKFFGNIRGDIRKSRYQRHWWFAKGTACVIVTGGKFSTGLNDINGK
jgi:hypothetical protein